MMPYDYPYRIERRVEYNNYATTILFAVIRHGDVVCESENYMALRRLIDAANTAAAIEQGDRGR